MTVIVSDLDAAGIPHGAVLAAPTEEPRATLDVRLRLVPRTVALLVTGMAVRVSIGTAEIGATLNLAADPRTVDLSTIDGRLTLREPIVAPAGCALILRRYACKTVLAGGTVVAAQSVAAAAASSPDPPKGLELLDEALRVAGFDGATSEELAERVALALDHVLALLEHLADEGRAYRLTRPSAYVDAALAEELLARLRAVLRRRERRTPWIMGVTSLALSRASGVAEPLLVRHLARAVADGALARRVGYYSSPAFVPRLTVRQRRFLEKELSIDIARPFIPRGRSAERLGAGDERFGHRRSCRRRWRRSSRSGSLIRESAMTSIEARKSTRFRARLDGVLRREGTIAVATFRDLLGASRRYAVPLLEWFDATGVTTRDGDARRLRPLTRE